MVKKTIRRKQKISSFNKSKRKRSTRKYVPKRKLSTRKYGGNLLEVPPENQPENITVNCEDELKDPITLNIFQDPVITADGHTYDRSSIERWFLNNNTSPLTGLVLPNKDLIPNILVRDFVDKCRATLNLEPATIQPPSMPQLITSTRPNGSDNNVLPPRRRHWVNEFGEETSSDEDDVQWAD